jgi:RNA polymerase sigma-70 factor (ECF subfamily)
MADSSSYSLSEIVEGCRRNERKFQKLLYDQYAKQMYRLCLSYIKESDAAQDVLQDGFIKVFKNIENYDDSGSMEGWIRRIIVNTAIDYLRSKKRLGNFIEYDDAIKSKEVTNDGIYTVNVESILLKVNQLPDGARAVFNLYALEGYSHKEIAKQLEITEGTSKSQFSRAKNLLKDWLKDFVN